MNKPLGQWSRRAFLQAASLGASTASLAGCTLLNSGDKRLADINRASNLAWQKADEILRNTPVPQFPKRDFLITDFGAKADGQTDSSKAIAAAITACHNAGGGRVIVPKGEFRTAKIHLLSQVNLHLEEGCRLAFSTQPNDYLPAVLTRWEGMEMMGYSPLVYAYGQENIALTGKGILDGQANENTWWPWKGGKSWSKPGVPTQDKARAQLALDVENNRAVNERIYAEGAFLRPPFVQFYNCKNILIADVTLKNAPFWLINPVLSENITVRGVTCASLGPNSDGCDPESCKNVVIDGCYFDTGDDCIAIKSGRNGDGRRVNVPAENIVIRNCKMRSGHGGVVIGSEISGGARHIFAENCEMNSKDLERGLRFKTNSVRGGLIENVYFRNINIGDVQTAIVVDFSYEEGDSGKFAPTVRNIEVRDLHCKNAQQVFNVMGYERSPIKSLHLINTHFDDAQAIGTLKNLDDFVTQNVTIKGKPFAI